MCETIKSAVMSVLAVVILSVPMVDITLVTSGEGYQQFAETVIRQPGR